MERVLKGYAKPIFLQKPSLVGGHTVANFTTVMATMTVLQLCCSMVVLKIECIVV